jgi:hypothetical protein
MKSGAENRKKTIMAGALGAGALVCLFVIYNTLFGGPDTPSTSTNPPSVKATAPAGNAGSSSGTPRQASNAPEGVAPGVEAQKLATATNSLDPTLDEKAMLRTESLVYTGAGRNIFSAVYTPPAAVKPLNLPAVSARPARPAAPVYTPPPGPPPPPPINLKFFGTATRPGGQRQAFLLSGDDVYLASQGDIVARKYKIGAVNANSVSITDLTNNNTQTLPLQMQ